MGLCNSSCEKENNETVEVIILPGTVVLEDEKIIPPETAHLGDEKIITPEAVLLEDKKIITPETVLLEDEKIISPETAPLEEEKIIPPETAPLGDKKIISPETALLEDQLLPYSGRHYLKVPKDYVGIFLKPWFGWTPKLLCAGKLSSDGYVLTAKTCVQTYKTEDLARRICDDNSKSPKYYDVTKFIFRAGRIPFDGALLDVKGLPKFPEKISKFPTNNHTNIELFFWAFNEICKTGSMNLVPVPVKIVPYEDFTSPIASFNEDNQEILEVIGDPPLESPGISASKGYPVMQKEKIIGIASDIIICNHVVVGIIMTKIPPFFSR